MKTQEQEATTVVLLGVYCDNCGLAVSADFKVRVADGPEVRGEYVRAWAVKDYGWSCVEGLDLCADCQTVEPSVEPVEAGDLLRSIRRDMDLAALQLRAGKFLDASVTFADVKASVFKLEKLVGK